MDCHSITLIPRCFQQRWVSLAAVTTCVVLSVPVASFSAADPPRVTRGLRVLYTFDAGRGATIHDRSGVGQPLNLKISKLSAVQWRPGSLLVRSSTTIVSAGPAGKISDLVKRTRAATIEAWIKPGNVRQDGPARIVSLSRGPSQRNLTLGQDRTQFDVRFRTSSTNVNGIPSTTTPVRTAGTGLVHVVFTREASGTARIFLDGKPRVSQKVTGHLNNWNGGFSLALANEVSGDRPWLGTLYLVAIFSRALSAEEVQQNFRAGVAMRVSPAVARDRHERFFETRIAGLLARHCLECHDSVAKKGGLDLSKKKAAFAGGKNGKVIVTGRSPDSRLWKRVAAGEMPPKGQKRLSDRDMKFLQQWIDAGATWSLEEIDAAVYAHDNRAGDLWVQRLTVPEYIETVRSAVGVDIARLAVESLPPDIAADGFRNTAYNLNVDLKHVEAYARLAQVIVGQMDVLKFSARFSKSRKLSTDDTMRELVAAMGKWLLRGPLDEREITNYSGIATTVASAGGDFQEAVGFIIEAMLQSPRFIYRVEQQRGDGTVWPVSDHELAVRMSYIIWGAPPDQLLIRAADAGQLQDRQQIESQVRRMLKDPRARERSSRFLAEWLKLDRLESLKPDRQKFPGWDPALAADMRSETLAFFQEVVWKQRRPLSDLLNAQFTFATPRLARHYGFSSRGPGLKRYDLSSRPARGGLLTQGSTLTIGGDEASMVTRGLFVFQDLLRGTVKDPPPGVDTTPVPPKPGLSQRQVSTQRIMNRSCAGCHEKIEPLAFGLEKFDGVGGFREKDEHGNVLREDGMILFPGMSKPARYRTSAELMDLLAGSERVRKTMTWKVTQFALGRPLVAADLRTVNEIHQSAWKDGGTYGSLLTAIVTSNLVMMTRTQTDQQNR